MRMRKKKNLEERISSYPEILFISEFEDRNFKTAVNKKDYLDLESWFGRKAPIYLEVGCGKGKFAVEYALAHPEINFLAVEKSANVIVDACKAAKEKDAKNLRFIKCGAEYLECYLRENSVDGIFLNFSCPFPKNSYATHRLTHINFLRIYKKLLKKGAEIHQKTDNMHFFEFSLEQFTLGGYKLKNISLDLHSSDFEGNIETEYEHRFASLGQPIYRLEAYLEDLV